MIFCNISQTYICFLKINAFLSCTSNMQIFFKKLKDTEKFFLWLFIFSGSHLECEVEQEKKVCWNLCMFRQVQIMHSNSRICQIFPYQEFYKNISGCLRDSDKLSWWSPSVRSSFHNGFWYRSDTLSIFKLSNFFMDLKKLPNSFFLGI